MRRTTIITPVYNGAALLAKTIASILAQDDPDFEYLIVDDGSTDASMEIANAAAAKDPRIKVLQMPRNSGGPAGPRNLGIREAEADWIAFCDADDLWAPSKLRLQHELAQRVEASIYGVTLQNFNHGDAIEPLAAPGGTPEDDIIPINSMLVKNWIGLSGAMVPKALFHKVGFFNEERAYAAVEDYDMWLRLMGTTGLPAVKLKAPLVHYRILPGSISRNKFKHLVKVMRVQQAYFEAKGQRTQFRITLPARILRYAAVSIVTRIFIGKL